MEEKNIITLPNEYLTLSDERLIAIAKTMYDRSVSAMYYDKDLNDSFYQDKETLKVLIDCYLYVMCCVDGSVNAKEQAFLTSLNPKFDASIMEKELDKSYYELFSTMFFHDKLSGVARDIMRITVIAAVIDSKSINEAESRFLHSLLDRIVL